MHNTTGRERGENFLEEMARDRCGSGPEPEPIVKAWPALPPEALYGLAGDVVRLATEDCEADPAAVLMTFLTGFGAACGDQTGKTPYLRIGETKHPPRLYGAIVGASARARKGTSKGPVQRLMDEAQWPDQDLNASSRKCPLPASFQKCPLSEGPLSSGEGIIHRLRDPSDERDKEGDLNNPGSSDKRLMVIEGELGSVFKVMQREGSIISTVLRVAWDGGTIEPLTKCNRIKATNPHLCIVGHITADELRELLTAVDLRNGLANRFLWCMARRTRLISRPLPMPDEAVMTLAARIRAALLHAAPAQVAWSESALEAWDVTYPELTAERPGAWGYATARAEAQVCRLALLYALLDSQFTIELDHLAAALGFWRYCDASAAYLFAESEADPIGNKILDALHAAGGEMSQTDLHGVFGRNLPAAKLAAVLTLLQEHGRITQVQRKTGGRTAVIWKLLPTKKEERSSANKERF